jgi:hypothetical protein
MFNIYFLKYIYFKVLLTRLPTEQLCWYILERVEKELLQISLLLLTRQKNYRWCSIGDMLYLPINILTDK